MNLVPLIGIIKIHRSFILIIKTNFSMRFFSVKSFLVSTFLLTTLPGFVIAQLKSTFNIDQLHVKWELIQNNFQNKDVALCQFSITNNSRIKFPEKGWTIYFTSSRDINPASVSSGCTITHVNGDIFQIKPSNDCKDVKPGKSLSVSYQSYGLTINYTAAPGGLYLVWDNDVEKGYPIKNYEMIKLVNNVEGIMTPEMVYKKNEDITNLPDIKVSRVFPTPVYYRELSGNCMIAPSFVIVADPAFENEKKYLEKELQQLFNPNSKNNENPVSKTTIILSKSDTVLKSEAYELIVKEGTITMQAGTASGIFYAIQTLKSLFPASAWKDNNDSFFIPNIVVADEPRFEYRSLNLDVARNFKSKKEIKKLIDLMAMYKLNVLHFHFSDDEGWRIAIQSLPELTSIGSNRGHTTDSKKLLPASYGAGPNPGKTLASGFYTRNDFIEILKYAHERHVCVIPEIESPGHSRAAIKSMDARYDFYISKGDTVAALEYLLRDLNDKSVYSSAQQWTDNVMCVAMPSVYHFLNTVIDELMSMYKDAGAPLHTIHMGGDEVPAGAWEQSPLSRQLLLQNSTYKTIDDLWYYFYDHVFEMLNQKNLIMSGWEEMGMRKTKLDGNNTLIVNSKYASKNIQLHVWNNMVGWGNEDLPYKLANAGFKVMLSPVSNNYFDLAYYKSPDEPGYYWGGFQDIDKPFYFIPYDYYKTTKEDASGNPVSQSAFYNKERLTAYGQSNIVGIEGLMWAENLRSNDQMEYLLLPKLLGMTERAWAQDPEWAKENDSFQLNKKYNEAWSSFVNRVGKYELPKLDTIYGGFNYRIPTPGVIVKEGFVYANVQFPGLFIRYTTDGTEPNINSRVYQEPLADIIHLKFATFNSKGRKSRTIETDPSRNEKKTNLP